MKIKHFDRPTVLALQAEIDAAVQEVAKRHGISLSMGNARFNANVVSFKLEGALIGADNVVNTKERLDFERYAEMYGLKASDIDCTFDAYGATYRISGLLPRSRKYPILATCEANGTRHKFPVEVVQLALKVARGHPLYRSPPVKGRC